MDLRLIQEFSGDGAVNVIEWLEKAELVCALRGITRLEAVLPLRLTGGAFAVYQQLTAEDKADSGKIKFALKTAFAVDAFTAYELFVARRLQPGETVAACRVTHGRPAADPHPSSSEGHPEG